MAIKRGEKLIEGDSAITAEPVVSTVDGETAKQSVRMIPGLNGGTIQNGWEKGKPNPRGQSPVSRLRDAMRSGLEQHLPGLLEDVAKGKIGKLQALDFLAKYGIGTTGTVTIVSPDVIARLEAQASAIASRESWDTVELLAMLRDIWT